MYNIANAWFSKENNASNHSKTLEKLDEVLKKYDTENLKTRSQKLTIAKIWFLKGQIAFQEKNFEEAIENLENALKKRLEVYGKSSNLLVAENQFLLAKAYTQVSEFKKAEPLFDTSYNARKLYLGEVSELV